MAGALNLMSLGNLPELRKDRIDWIGLVRAPNVPASGHCQAMTHLRASLGNQEIVPSVFFVNMRSLGITTACSVPQYFALSQLFPCHWINLAKHDPIRIGDHVALAVLKEERRVNSSLLQIDRLRPRSFRILSGHKEIASRGDIRGDHVICPIIIADRGGEDSAGRIRVHKGNLALPVKDIADQFPVDQVCRMVNRHPGEILERGINYVIIVSDPAD